MYTFKRGQTRRERRLASEKSMDIISSKIYRDNTLKDKAERQEKNKKWLRILMDSFCSEFREDDQILALVQNSFSNWERQRLRRDFTLAIYEISRLLSNCSEDVISRFELLSDDLKKRFEAEKRREALKKEYIQFRARMQI